MQRIFFPNGLLIKFYPFPDKPCGSWSKFLDEMASSNYQTVGIPIGNNKKKGFSRNEIRHVEIIRKMADKDGYQLEQRNGQRKFGPPLNWEGPEPGVNCEVFIGHIPKGIFEDTLIPLFAHFGTIHTFRLMMDFSGQNRGFGFCCFYDPACALRASMFLDEFEILPGKRIGVMKAVENNSLIINDIPYCGSIREKIVMCTLGVTNISFENRFDGNVNVIVTYKDHRSSALARRFLMNQGSNIFNTQKIVLVDWAKRNRESDDNNNISRVMSSRCSIPILPHVNVERFVPNRVQNHFHVGTNEISPSGSLETNYS